MADALFDRSWRERSKIAPVSRGDAEEMIRRHYLGCWPAVVVLRLGLYVDGALCGVIVFSLPPRETAKRYGGATWELARLWVDDAVPRNVETWLIGQAVRWIKRQRRDVAFLVSYADPSAGHAGTIYRAANWQDDGRTDQDRKTPRFDYVANGRRYQRRGHIPEGATITRVPRVSKHRFVLALRRTP